MKKGFKECPYCANKIKEGAIKCQYCGEYQYLDGFGGDYTNGKKSKKYGKIILRCIIGVMVIALCCIVFGWLKHKDTKNQINSDANNTEEQISVDVEKYTYNSRYPGFNEYDYNTLVKLADDKGLTGDEKTQFMDAAYQYYYPQVLNIHKLEEMQIELDKLKAEYSGNKAMEKELKIRDLVLQAKRAKGILYDVPDEDVINAMKNDIPNGEQLILNYLNNGDPKILYIAGITNELLKPGWSKYDNGEISFQYPEGLEISESDFQALSYFNGINIHVKKFNYDSYLDLLSDDLGYWAYELSDKELNDYKKQKKIQYRDTLTSVKNGTRNGEKLCTYGCSVTAGIIGSKKISVNGVNGIINNYYFTQDPELACFTEINTEILLVKDENTIYSIMFKYNFGDAYTFMYPYKTSSDEICIYHTYPGLASSWNSNIEGFFGYKFNSLQGKEVAPFEKTYNKIIEIMETIRFNGFIENL